MANTDPMQQALTAFRNGRNDEARDIALAIWNQAADVRAATLLALLEVDAKRPSAALDWTRQALARDPGNARLHLQAGRLSNTLGQPRSAADAFSAATRLDPSLGRGWLELGHVLVQLGDRESAIEALVRAERFETERSGATQALLDALPSTSPAAQPASTAVARAAAAREPISIVTCSIDDTRFNRASKSYAKALAGWPHEIVRISDARSLAEGYTRGTERASYPIIIFSHDDVEILTSDFGSRLARHLASCDIVGIAGATKAAGPAWSHAGHPHLHGCVVGPTATGLEVQVFSVRGPLIGRIQVLDGVFLAMRREIAAQVGWDAETFDGFHGYDVDFTLRAATSGLRLAVATDLGVLHHSRGHFGDAWRVAADKLKRKHLILNGPPSQSTHWYGRAVDSSDEAVNIADRLVACFSDNRQSTDAGESTAV